MPEDKNISEVTCISSTRIVLHSPLAWNVGGPFQKFQIPVQVEKEELRWVSTPSMYTPIWCWTPGAYVSHALMRPLQSI